MGNFISKNNNTVNLNNIPGFAGTDTGRYTSTSSSLSKSCTAYYGGVTDDTAGVSPALTASTASYSIAGTDTAYRTGSSTVYEYDPNATEQVNIYVTPQLSNGEQWPAFTITKSWDSNPITYSNTSGETIRGQKLYTVYLPLSEVLANATPWIDLSCPYVYTSSTVSTRLLGDTGDESGNQFDIGTNKEVSGKSMSWSIPDSWPIIGTRGVWPYTELTLGYRSSKQAGSFRGKSVSGNVVSSDVAGANVYIHDCSWDWENRKFNFKVSRGQVLSTTTNTFGLQIKLYCKYATQ